MRKIHYLLLAAVATLAACSQNEITAELSPVAPTLINFAPQFGNTVATRAPLDIALGRDVSLGVFAFYKTGEEENSSYTAPAGPGNYPTTSLFSKYDDIWDMRLRLVGYTPAVIGTGTVENPEVPEVPGAWLLNPAEHYYPADNAPVTFWAYGPKGNTHLSKIKCDSIGGPEFTLTLNSTDIGPTEVDIFATQQVQSGKLSAADNSISFTLKHLLAQVQFLAKTKTAQDALDYDIRIYDIAIETMYCADYAKGEWVEPKQDDITGNYPTNQKPTDLVIWKPVDADDTQAILTADKAPVGESVSLIPGKDTRIIVKARIYKKNQSAMVVEQMSMLFLNNAVNKPLQAWLKAGKRYIYSIIVEPKVGKITFDAPQITDWDPTAGDIEIPQPPVAP